MKKFLIILCLLVISQATSSFCNADDAVKESGLVDLPFTVDGQK